LQSLSLLPLAVGRKWNAREKEKRRFVQSFHFCLICLQLDYRRLLPPLLNQKFKSEPTIGAERFSHISLSSQPPPPASSPSQWID
jgi:hypothetical protein